MYYEEFDSGFLESCDDSLRKLEDLKMALQTEARSFILEMMGRWGRELKLKEDAYCCVSNTRFESKEMRIDSLLVRDGIIHLNYVDRDLDRQYISEKSDFLSVDMLYLARAVMHTIELMSRYFNGVQIFKQCQDGRLTMKEVQIISEQEYRHNDDRANGYVAFALDLADREAAFDIVDRLNEVAEANGEESCWWVGDEDEEYVFTE